MDTKYHKTLHLFVFLQFKLITEHNCMVDDHAMGRISSSDYLMQIPWGEIRYLLFVCWHRKYCISIENHYWSYLKRRKSVIYHDLYLFLILCTAHEQYFPWYLEWFSVGYYWYTWFFDDWIGNLVKYKYIDHVNYLNKIYFVCVH